MTKGKSKIVKLAGTSYFRRIRVSSNRNRLVQFNKVPRVRIPLSPTRNKTLMDKLHNLGYVKKTRLLTPEMVKEIVAVIGEP